jgi:hypothetical protein
MFVIEIDGDGLATVSDLWSTGDVVPKRDS